MSNPSANQHEKILATTLTGEIYQPVRLYYRVYNRELLVSELKKLQCLQFDSKNTRWVWLFSGECDGLIFRNTSDEIRASGYTGDVVLGSFYCHGNSHICLDLASHERTLHALEFFDHRISTDAIKVEHADVVNCLFSIDEIKNLPLSTVLDNPNLIKLAKTKHNSRMDILPLHFYEDGVGSVKTTLTLRQVVAKEHWFGNEDFSTEDIFKKIFGAIGQK